LWIECRLYQKPNFLDGGIFSSPALHGFFAVEIPSNTKVGRHRRNACHMTWTKPDRQVSDAALPDWANS
jgi:hypothetical protein